MSLRRLSGVYLSLSILYTCHETVRAVYSSLSVLNTFHWEDCVRCILVIVCTVYMWMLVLTICKCQYYKHVNISGLYIQYQNCMLVIVSAVYLSLWVLYTWHCQCCILVIISAVHWSMWVLYTCHCQCRMLVNYVSYYQRCTCTL